MISAVDFVSVNVADQERAKRFYTEVLGLELLTRRTDGGTRRCEVGRGASAWLADEAGAVPRT